jgi:hypothetical protein
MKIDLWKRECGNGATGSDFCCEQQVFGVKKNRSAERPVERNATHRSCVFVVLVYWSRQPLDSMMSQGVATYQLKKVSDVAESAALQAAEAHGSGDAEFVFPRTTVCNRFHIKEKIGSGGFGAIYKGMFRRFLHLPGLVDFLVALRPIRFCADAAAPVATMKLSMPI